jgi:hypothetical protein
MATALEEIGSPLIGQSFAVNRQVKGGGNNRIISRRYKMRIADREHYTVPIIEPTLYDSVYPLAVIVGQEFQALAGQEADCHLIRHFAEIPTEWDEPIDRQVGFPAVLRGSLYGPADFPFRSAQALKRSDVRINRKYFLSDPRRIPRFDTFRVLDQDGAETSTITDYTTPNTDEWVAMVRSGQEIILDCKAVLWRGWIHCRETTFATAK